MTNVTKDYNEKNVINVYIDDKYIYSIHMIYAYINLFNLVPEKIKIKQVVDNLSQPVWNNKTKPIDVLSVMMKKENNNNYSEDIKQIKQSDVEKPIIITENDIIIDGMYILAKSKLDSKQHVNAYIIDKSLLKKFRILRHNETDKIKTLNINNYIEIFVKNVIINKISENKHMFNLRLLNK